jgi:hypothetical protein
MPNFEMKSDRIGPSNDASVAGDEPSNYRWQVEAAQQAWARPEQSAVSDQPASRGTDSSIANAAGVILLAVSPFGSTTLAFAAQVYEQDARP